MLGEKVKGTRFELVHPTESLGGKNISIENTIVRDKVTGVLYLYGQKGSAGGLSIVPLLVADGKPIVQESERDFEDDDPIWDLVKK